VKSSRFRAFLLVMLASSMVEERTIEGSHRLPVNFKARVAARFVRRRGRNC
jgi:hypothetical protein